MVFHYLYPYFFFNDPAPTEIYTLSLHDALPIFAGSPYRRAAPRTQSCRTSASSSPSRARRPSARRVAAGDRKSTRLNSSHVAISYAVFCLKKKKKKDLTTPANIAT